MDPQQEQEIRFLGFRFSVLIGLTTLLFFVLLVRLIFLQIYYGEELNKFSDSNRFKKQLLIAPRGVVFDRKGRILSKNRQAAGLVFYFQSWGEESFSILKKVSAIIDTPPSSLKQIIEKEKKRQGLFHPAVLKKELSLEEIHQLKQLSWDHPEIQVRAFNKRIYPLKENGAHFLGFIGPISTSEIRRFKAQNRRFNPGDLVGKSGLEKLYDEDLRGKNGYLMAEVDAKGRVLNAEGDSPFDLLKIAPKKGRDLTLTIDKDIQEAAFKAMNRKDSRGPRKGSVVVMKTNGELLALLSLPSFDPNRLSLQRKEALWESWSQKGSKVFINKALAEHYSPGSVFKPFVALAALSEGLITPETLILSPGAFRVGRRLYRDHNTKGYGEINVETALERSSNTFFYQLGIQIAPESFYKYMKWFGFGQTTGLLLSGESPGLLPHPAWKKKTLNEPWHKGDSVNVSIGQGPLLTTLLQLAVAYNAIATEGLIVQPFIVLKDPQSRLKKPVILDSLTNRIPRRHFQTVKQGLRRVLEGSHGTARGYKIPSFSFAGKTGTAQVIRLSSDNYKKCKKLPLKQRHHGWFVSFAPVNRPQIVVAVLTEHSCSGSGGSAPVARDIIKSWRALNRPPSSKVSAESGG